MESLRIISQIKQHNQIYNAKEKIPSGTFMHWARQCKKQIVRDESPVKYPVKKKSTRRFRHNNSLLSSQNLTNSIRFNIHHSHTKYQDTETTKIISKLKNKSIGVYKICTPLKKENIREVSIKRITFGRFYPKLKQTGSYT